MSSKIAIITGLALTLSAVGCSGHFISKEDYDRDMVQSKEYIDALTKENADLKMKCAEYDRLKAESEANGDSSKFYADLAKSLKDALKGLGVADSGVTVNPRTGAVEFSRDVLFDLGSWTISAKGQQVLKSFAETQRGNLIKIVGHTDSKPIVREATKKALDTDTNMELSARRAIAVMGALLKNGIREPQIASVEGHGVEPTSNNGVARCVEIFVVKGAQVAPTSATKAKTVKK